MVLVPDPPPETSEAMVLTAIPNPSETTPDNTQPDLTENDPPQISLHALWWAIVFLRH